MSDNTKAIRMTPEVVEAINELLAESNVDLTIVSLTNAEEALKMTAYDDDKLWEFFRFARDMELIRRQFEKIGKLLGYEREE